ncbi:MAG TPA: NAD(P)/FAD-dependent oxidoreductase [Hyphomicrobiaceae bacterium]|jgi:NADPH-dependent 2,4-dienoyl-CoA reductase/sulfur reductase-like enzyme|nr:NAD(P)/FAD-dependent oxidoreductase [Hyphomicrobiaceae bacterium]
MISRRGFARVLGRAGAGALSLGALAPFATAQRAPRVVIVGGGAGGATVAHYVKAAAAELDVTLIESRQIYSSSFFSNLYLGGLRPLESFNHSYVALQRLGVKVVHDLAIDVDSARKTVKTRGGRTYGYERLVLAPGIAIQYDSLPGYSHEVARALPHAYTTNPAGTRNLKHQLQAMRDGGTVLIAAPNDPYRCPPAPYERACMIAHYLKTKKPKSKLVILDAKRTFAKQELFVEAFERHYKNIVELNLSTEIDDFSLSSVDAKSKEVRTRANKRVRFDVANIIPAQRAGDIAGRAGCTDRDWCPIDPATCASSTVKDVYVLGDAAVAADMPKSAYSANSQAKVVAGDILAHLVGKGEGPSHYSNTCWSLLAPEDGVKLGADYVPKGGKLVAEGAFSSAPGESAELRRQTYLESVDWYERITTDMFARVQRGAEANKR